MEARSPVSTLDAVLEDFTESWERGDRPRAERYLGFLRAEDSAELIYHEYCLAEASDLEPDPADYLLRFPEQAETLGRLFTLHGVFSTSTLREWADPADLPSAGDEIGPYRLLRELGRGAFARVFLVEQADLDHRLVVLKVSTRSTSEPRLLARARHPHIVEVLRHDVANEGALHLVCMPFLGGATLASVLERRRKVGRRPWSGLDLVADLDRVSAAEYPSAELVRPAREILAGLSYSNALAWIVARLAEALDHAHHRGVAHGDLKPSNVLLTAEGSPLLLDFNLSVDWQKADADGSTADLGGTLAYMAPERLRSIADGGLGRPPKANELHRADLYALGLLLLEALTGRPPEVHRRPSSDPRDIAEGLARVRQTLPVSLRGGGDRSIPPALRSILRRCLAPDPADRYARGNELAEDLDRCRSDRPLVFAEEARSSELIRGARRRRSTWIALGLTLVSALTVAYVSSMVIQGTKRDQALSKYSMIVSRADSGCFGFRKFGEWRDEDTTEPAEKSARQLARYEVLDDPDWRDRDDIKALPDRERGELEAWLFEQILRHAVALGERPEAEADWRRALGVLERTLGRATSAPLLVERQALRVRLKLPEAGVVATGQPRLPRWLDEYLAGVAAEPLHAREALGHYLEALRDRPGMFWARYRAAIVACRIGEYDVAAEHLRGCVRRYPENPALHLQLASTLHHDERETLRGFRVNRLADALSECDRAVTLAPDFASAYQIRAQIRKASGQDDGSREDLDRYASLEIGNGPASAMTLGLSLNLPFGMNRGQPSDAVATLAGKILENDPRANASRMNLASRLALENKPIEAIGEYDRVLEINPDHLRGRYFMAQQRKKLDPARAMEEFSSLINHPRFEELLTEQPTAIRAFHYVATDLMEHGRTAEALDVANRAMVHVNRSRSLQTETTLARLQWNTQFALEARGETHYLIARIHAAFARTDSRSLGEVVDHLGRAIATSRSFRTVWFASDRHFDALRTQIVERLEPEFLDR